MKNTAEKGIKENDCSESIGGEGMPFRVPTLSWLMIILGDSPWVTRSLFGIFLLGITGVVMGFIIDLRCAIVGLMLILLVLPMIFTMVFIVYGFKSLNAVNLTHHTIVRAPDGSFLISVFSPQKDEESPEKPLWRLDRQIIVEAERIDPNRRVFTRLGDWYGTRDNEWVMLPKEKNILQSV